MQVKSDLHGKPSRIPLYWIAYKTTACGFQSRDYPGDMSRRRQLPRRSGDISTRVSECVILHKSNNSISDTSNSLSYCRKHFKRIYRREDLNMALRV